MGFFWKVGGEMKKAFYRDFFLALGMLDYFVVLVYTNYYC